MNLDKQDHIIELLTEIRDLLRESKPIVYNIEAASVDSSKTEDYISLAYYRAVLAQEAARNPPRQPFCLYCQGHHSSSLGCMARIFSSNPESATVK